MFFILIGFKYILNRCFVLTGLDTLNIDKNDLDPVSLLMNLPIQKKNMAALVTSTLHLPQANPKNKIPYTKLNSITENRKKQKKTKIPEKGWGAHSCWIFVFFCVFLVFSVFVFFWWFCLLYRLSIGVVLPWKCFLHCCRSLLPTAVAWSQRCC